VIVQRLVEPVIAGVAFTGLEGGEGPRVLVEYVEGLADTLVAGAAIPSWASSDDMEQADPRYRAALDEVVEIARRLRRLRGQDVDVEWAADDQGVHLIQVRPLTARNSRPSHSRSPHVELRSLYFDRLPSAFSLGAVAAVYGTYVGKRAPAYRLAVELGVDVGPGWVVRFNGRGLHDPETAAALVVALARGASSRCVLDLGDTLRQLVLPKSDVIRQLAEASAATPGSDELHTAIVRDFVHGDLGLISRLTGDGLLVEYTPEGLMALNRGTAGARSIHVADLAAPVDQPGNLTAPADAGPLLPSLATIARLTAAMRERRGPVTLEWVSQGDRLYFVDYSVLGGDEVHVASGALRMSPGTASGPLLRLEDDELLRRLSIGPAVSVNRSRDVSDHEGLARVIDRVRSAPVRPVVHARRPYAVLSVLIGDVAGFVFEEGSTLCHLAILLREAGLPALACPGLVGDGEVVIGDGTATLVPRSLPPGGGGPGWQGRE
jgi:hypothetical protein